MNDCETCDISINRTILNNSCICVIGYYDTGSDLCSACNSYCKACTV